MLMERFTLFLSNQEMQALEACATTELRNFREQARLIIRQELERKGFLLAVESESALKVFQELQMKVDKN